MAAPKGHPNYASPDNLGGRPKIYTLEVIERFADELLEWCKVDSNFWFKDFALEKEIHPDYLYDWAKQSDRFSHAFDVAFAKQESKLFKGGMLDKYNMTMTKMALTNWHNWKEKTETKISGDPIDPFCLAIQNLPSSKDLVKDGEK